MGKSPPSKPSSQSLGKSKVKADSAAAAKRTTERKVASPSGSIREPAGDWRVETLESVRRIIHEADPEMIEECKWIKPSNPLGVPVWSRGGIVCTGETYKQVVKLTFAKGAALADPQRLFNSSLEGNTRRAIDIREGETVDAGSLKALIQAAVTENLRVAASKSKAPLKTALQVETNSKESVRLKGKQHKQVVLLAGGNPQIAKADGDAPVQAYLAAMPGWKSDLGMRLDALIMRNAPHLHKAVRWNSPFYGIEGQGWFVSFHVLTRYVKVTFFNGVSLRPIPPGGTPKSKDARWIDIYEDDELDEQQFSMWVKQAAALPGWIP